ncbi:Glycosyltransferase involved in cell wall bisynthesis [Pseudobutyrivibrio sp. OR37]|uniref:glycosyltransferase family 2 protein n=1 Tax=Pseudobutyrivibrio sp. OR37 TaxID=1798186 RepID=UPI0008E1E355|nr:glycosyltransferase family 2 protein [Pseudobutyrivibrio sp. OR37]SFI20483.1 Glycosyltransferase involved in cell wall bisynthesis [Pseudobutyrivibrio sp. OR37]
MKITVITPFYEGDKYMDGFIDSMLSNELELKQAGHSLEVILVNDSPWKKLQVPSEENSFIKVVTNDENKGIHYSRVTGLNVATGDYVMFLDQDDVLEGNALVQMLSAAIAKSSKVLVCNALLEQSDGSKLLWYRNDYHKSLISDLATYLRIGIQIISPGQCLIKKDIVPEFWQEHLVQKNGADDYYLWLLLLAAGVRFDYLDQPLYTHRYTKSNLSKDTNITDASVYDFLDLLAECDYFKQEDIFTLHEMITYKNQFRASSTLGKITCSLANLGLFIDNLKFKKYTGTGYGFNR